MKKLRPIGFGVLCLIALFVSPFSTSAQDTDPPVILSAVAGCDGLTITVSYNEPVEPFSASDVLNYSILDGTGFVFAIINALMVDSQTVLLQIFAPLDPASAYTLEACCISDLVGNSIIPFQTVPTVFDTAPPEVTCSIAVNTLFPANNALVDVGLTAAADSTGSPVRVQVYSDEPALAALPDATYENGVLKLRARRNPGSDGRVYLIVASSTDQCGNVGVCCTTVVIPQNGSAAALRSAQAQAAAAQAQCSPSGSPSTPDLILP
jgi:hypothetical protein